MDLFEACLMRGSCQGQIKNLLKGCHSIRGGITCSTFRLLKRFAVRIFLDCIIQGIKEINIGNGVLLSLASGFALFISIYRHSKTDI